MLFDLKQAPGSEKIILQAVKLRRPIPKAFANAPRLHPWLGVFYLAFEDLITERLWEDGPIPWSARQKWAEVHGLDGLATELLHTHIRAMHLAFLKHRRDTLPGAGQSGKGGGDAGPSGLGEQPRKAFGNGFPRRQ